KRRGECEGAAFPLDPGQLLCCPVARDLGELHPHQAIVAGVEAAGDLLECLEAQLFAVEVDPGPVADEDRRLAALNHVDQTALLQVGGDEPVRLRRSGAIPTPGPVTGAADD